MTTGITRVKEHKQQRHSFNQTQPTNVFLIHYEYNVDITTNNAMLVQFSHSQYMSTKQTSITGNKHEQKQQSAVAWAQMMTSFQHALLRLIQVTYMTGY